MEMKLYLKIKGIPPIYYPEIILVGELKDIKRELKKYPRKLWRWGTCK